MGSRTKSPPLRKRSLVSGQDFKEVLAELSEHNLAAVTLQDETGQQRGVRVNTVYGALEYYKGGNWHGLPTGTRVTDLVQRTVINRSGGGSIYTGEMPAHNELEGLQGGLPDQYQHFSTWAHNQLGDWIGWASAYLDNGFVENLHIGAADVDIHRGGAGILALGTSGAGDRGFHLRSATAGSYAAITTTGSRVDWRAYSSAMYFLSDNNILDFVTGPGKNMIFDCGSLFYFRDRDTSWAIRLTIDSSNGDIVPGTDLEPDIGDSTHRIQDGHINQWYGTQGGPEADADLMVLAADLLTVNGDVYVTKATPVAWAYSTAAGLTAITRTMAGLRLSSVGMNTTSKYTPGVLFMSTDPDFTTENPKLLAGIWGQCMETYAGDIDGAMQLVFGTTPYNPGVNSVPTINMALSKDGYLGINATNHLHYDGYDCLGDTYTAEASANYLLDTVGNTATFGRITGNVGIPATGRIYLDGVACTAANRTTIRQSADDIITFECNAIDQWSLNATAFYPVADNAETIGTSALGPSALYLSDANTTEPSAEGEVRAHPHKTVAWYLGGIRQLGASLVDDALVTTATVVDVDGTLALTNVAILNTPAAFSISGNSVHVVARGTAKCSSNPGAPGATMSIQFRIEDTVVFTLYLNPAITETHWKWFEFEFDATIRSSTSWMISRVKGRYYDWVGAAPWPGLVAVGLMKELSYTWETPFVVSGAVTSYVRCSITNGKPDNSYCSVIEFKQSLEDF